MFGLVGISQLPSWATISVGILLIVWGGLVLMGLGERYTEWVIRKVFRKHPSQGWTGRIRSSLIYKALNIWFDGIFLIAIGVVAVIAGVARAT